MKPFEERLWGRVDKTADGGCWVWTGALNAAGYGAIGKDNKVLRVHRVTYELLVGPIPEGLQLDHLCRNRACCNPEHLEPVTNRTNWLRGQNPTAVFLRDGICKRGHEVTPENTYKRKNGGLLCRLCVLENNANWRQGRPGPTPEEQQRRNELQRIRRRQQREAQKGAA
jgi:hypothetical protein